MSGPVELVGETRSHHHMRGVLDAIKANPAPILEWLRSDIVPGVVLLHDGTWAVVPSGRWETGKGGVRVFQPAGPIVALPTEGDTP